MTAPSATAPVSCESDGPPGRHPSAYDARQAGSPACLAQANQPTPSHQFRRYPSAGAGFPLGGTLLAVRGGSGAGCRPAGEPGQRDRRWAGRWGDRGTRPGRPGRRHPYDTPELAAKLAAKLWHLRILDGEKSCSDVAAPLLVISQFTLYADTRKGRRPSWLAAAPGPVAEPLVDAVVCALRELGARVETGVFGADMKVSLVNDGPVTIILEL